MTRVLRLSLALAALTVVGLAGAGAASARTVWLCKPGQSPDPCNPSLATTVFSPSLHKLKVIQPARDKKPSIDCFYVYPTVSDQKTTLANRHIDPEERSIALYQAARYSQYCRVFAPMYRQVTVTALDSGTQETPQQLATPVGDVRAAFATYLRKYNHGRGFVLIGHSQGSFVLEQLIAKDVDKKPAVRKRLVSSILLGGNVLVKRGTGVGGSFQHVPACRSDTQLACVIAFSTFDQPPPADSLFGRTKVPGDQVLCTNPAALRGGAAQVDPIFPSAPFAPGTLIAAGISLLKITQPPASTTWISEPGAYRARCSSAGGANVLQITPLSGAQTATPSPDPTWGLHLLDANIELGSLVSLVHSEANAFAARPAAPLAPSSH
ncbi:MAG TPA: DUF3089 domain-containing protein [Solirubrobacteraceae bacterium]|jgi:hypothetical protein